MRTIVCVLISVLSLVLFAEEEKTGFKVKEIEPFFYCAVEKTGSFEQHNEAFQTLYEQAAQQGFGSDFTPFGIYYNNPNQVPVEDLKWDVGFALEDSVDAKAPLKVKKWEYTMLASSMYKGSFDGPEFSQAIANLMSWVMENGYTPAGPMMEKFMDMPTQDADGGWAGTVNFFLPVQKQ